MAGIYIHIPFCRKKCYYCDFYKTTSIKEKETFLGALKKEIGIRRCYLQGEDTDTVYFGGGTPSLLSPLEIKSIIGYLNDNLSINKNAEITVELNPDDINLNYLADLREFGINRLSIGIQSFFDEDLARLNRRHNADQALKSIEYSNKAGFRNISIDLIYGMPGLTLPRWKENLKTAVSLPVNHLSAYHLTFHEGTPFYRWLKEGKISELSEKESIDQFEMLWDVTYTAGFEQYEISNFARNKAYSKHNSHYWSGISYLGLGPSAHSYNGISRQWNISDIEEYILRINQEKAAYEMELLSEKDKINDYLITRLRTKWGISYEYLMRVFGPRIKDHIEMTAKKYLQSGHLEQNDKILSLTKKGMMLSDQILLAFIID